MMKKNLFLLLLLISCDAYGQYNADELQVQIGGYDKEFMLGRNPYIGADTGKLYLLGSAKQHSFYYELGTAAFNDSLSRIGGCEVKSNYEGKTAYFQRAILFSGRILAFYYCIKDHEAFYYYSEVDPETMTVKGEKHIIEKIEMPSGMFFKAVEGIGKFYSNPFAFMEAMRSPFEVILSKDKSVLAILVTWRGLEEEKNKYPVSAKVYGKDMQMLWERKIKIPYDPKYFNDYYSAVDSMGNIYIGGAANDQSQKPVPHVLFFSEEGSRMTNCNIGLLGHYDGYYAYHSPGDGNITCTGLVAEDAKRTVIKGAWSYRIDLQAEKIISGSDLLFNDDILQKFAKKTKEGGLVEFYPKAILNEGVTTYLVLESITTIGSAQKSTTDLVVFCFSDGKEKPWVKGFSFKVKNPNSEILQNATLPFAFGNVLYILYNAAEDDIISKNILSNDSDIKWAEGEGNAIGCLVLYPEQIIRNRLFLSPEKLDGCLLYTQSLSAGSTSASQLLGNEDDFKLMQIINTGKSGRTKLMSINLSQ